MNYRTFLVALALIGAVALVVAATDNGPTDTAPAFGLRRGHGGGGGRPPGPPRLSRERVAELLERMQREQPKVHEHLVRLRRDDRRAFMRAMIGIDRFVRRLADLPEPVRAAMIQQRKDRLDRHRLLKQYHQTTDEGRREELRGKIRELVGRMFDTDQMLKEHKVKQLTQELEALKRELADRVGRREELIDQTVDRLLDAWEKPRP